jgi:hypothetical protein
MAERKRIGVPISGLDTSTPDHSVVDGKCETLHNLRYTGEAWRNVKGFENKAHILPTNYELAYRFPFNKENSYLAIDRTERNKTLKFGYTSRNSESVYFFDNEIPSYGDKVLVTPPSIPHQEAKYEDAQYAGFVNHYDQSGQLTYFTNKPEVSFAAYSVIEYDNALEESIDFNGSPLYIHADSVDVNKDVFFWQDNNLVPLGVVSGFREEQDILIITVLLRTVIDESQTATFKVNTNPDTFAWTSYWIYNIYTGSNNDRDRESIPYMFNGQIKAFRNIRREDNKNTHIGQITDITDNGDYYTVSVIYAHTEEISTFRFKKGGRFYEKIVTDYIERYPSADITTPPTINLDLLSIFTDSYNFSQTICTLNPDHSYEFKHFGNMLFVIDSTEKSIASYLYDLSKNKLVSVYNSFIQLSHTISQTFTSPGVEFKDFSGRGGELYYKVMPIENFMTISETQDHAWSGELACFATLTDASNGICIATSNIHIINSIHDMGRDYSVFRAKTINGISLGKEHLCQRVTAQGSSYNGAGLCSQFISILPALHIELADDLPADCNIELYATRIYPHNTAIDIDIMQENFHKLGSYSCKDFTNNKLSVQLDAATIKNMEQASVYEPNLSTKTFYFNETFEYNNRLHIIKPELSPIEIEPHSIFFSFDDEQGHAANCVLIETAKSGLTTFSKMSISDFRNFYKEYLSANIQAFNPNQGFCLTFDSHSFTKGFAYFANDKGDNNFDIYSKSPLSHSASTDKLYYLNKAAKNDVFIKYSDIILNDDTIGSIHIDKQEIIDGNKIAISETNNPTSFPYGLVSYIGSTHNEIIAINSGAIEMSDTKFGEFPVYVFTKEGIFAMQSGKDTLYSAIIPINYDVVINPNTLAVNGSVLYFTDKGLHALTNQGAKLLSAPVHTNENRIPEWMYTTQLVYLPEWNEVLCTDLTNKKAYVYSLDNGVWSTRDIPEGYILNNDELVATDDMIYNLRNEKEQSKDAIGVSLATRPIKLGSMELKRAETIIVRFECPTNQTLNVKVEGSIDTQNWGDLRNIEGVQTNKDILIRRTPCSVKYLRFTIEGNVTDDIRILAFEVEYYNKWVRKMR